MFFLLSVLLKIRSAWLFLFIIIFLFQIEGKKKIAKRKRGAGSNQIKWGGPLQTLNDEQRERPNENKIGLGLCFNNNSFIPVVAWKKKKKEKKKEKRQEIESNQMGRSFTNVIYNEQRERPNEVRKKQTGRK